MTADHVDLLWLPVGAGGHVVVHTSRWWEVLRAHRERRHPSALFHAALDLSVDGTPYVIEMTPAWSGPRGVRGVVASGPVGTRWLGAWRLFRYEVRCWANGTIPDRDLAVGPVQRFALVGGEADALLRRVPEVPTLVWGRDAYGIGDMWNSNSLVAWLLETSGIDAVHLGPPDGGSAPGWASGIAAAHGVRRRRSQRHD